LITYDDYVLLIRALAEKKERPLESLTKQLEISEEETLVLLNKLIDIGLPLVISSDSKKNSLLELKSKPDVYAKHEIVSKLSSEINCNSVDLSLFVSIDSTNTYLKNISNAENKLLICIADQQTHGRGRRGKTWLASFGSNICFSLRQRLALSPVVSTGASLVAGLSIVKALSALGYDELEIKWPNDIYCSNKKLGGVLIEVVGIKPDSIELIIGVGLNVLMPEANEIDQPWIDLKQITAGELPSRNIIVVTIINQLVADMRLFESQGLSVFMDDWAQYDYLFGKQITVKQESGDISGKAVGLSQTGELKVEFESRTKIINAGEVSVRLEEKVS